MKPTEYASLSHAWLDLVPAYRSRSYQPLHISFPWDPEYAAWAERLSPSRVAKRRRSYEIPGELDRSTGSIRFGVEKTGAGVAGRRADFCLIGAAFHRERHDLTVFYRRLELQGGLHFDLPMFQTIHDDFRTIRTLTIYALVADVFAPKGNSNERLNPVLRAYHEGRAHD